jgi:hypothetical protein
MRKIVLFASISLMAGLLFTNVYNSLVDAANWCSNIPASIEQARQYYSVANPGESFYRIFSPINQVLALVAMILYWRTDRRMRINLATALALALVADALTFGYFYPRNEILFFSDLAARQTQITDACTQWQGMNWVRSLFVLAGLVFQFFGLNRLMEIRRGGPAVASVDQ